MRRASFAHDGQHAPQFLVERHGLGARPRGFAADVEDVRAFRRRVAVACSTAALVIEEPAAVGEAVGRDVDDPHDERPAAELDHAVAELPEKRLHSGTIHQIAKPTQCNGWASERWSRLNHFFGAALSSSVLIALTRVIRVRGDRGLEPPDHLARRGR